MLKITEAWKNRDEVINLCKLNNACVKEFKRLINAQTQEEFENVLLNNFSWCVKNNVLEEYLPEMPNATEVNCWDCTGLKELNLPNATKVFCNGCTGLTKLSLPNATTVFCYGCTGLKKK